MTKARMKDLIEWPSIAHDSVHSWHTFIVGDLSRFYPMRLFNTHGKHHLHRIPIKLVNIHIITSA